MSEFSIEIISGVELKCLWYVCVAFTFNGTNGGLNFRL